MALSVGLHLGHDLLGVFAHAVRDQAFLMKSHRGIAAFRSASMVIFISLKRALGLNPAVAYFINEPSVLHRVTFICAEAIEDGILLRQRLVT